jgi:hypothetical protein
MKKNDIEKRLKRLEEKLKPKSNHLATWVDFIRYCEGEISGPITYSEYLKDLFEGEDSNG